MISNGVARTDGETAEAPPIHIASNTQLVHVPLPIVGEVDTQLIAMIEDWLGRRRGQPTQIDGPRHPILILEFCPPATESGRGSQFERSLALARYLAGPRLSEVRVVAYLSGEVQGHAVLPVLACEQIIAAPDATLGLAGVDEQHIDDAIRSGYREIAERRRTLPIEVVMKMLEERPALYRVKTMNGLRYIEQGELESFKQNSAPSRIDQIAPDGEMARFSGADLRVKYGFASHLASDRLQLATALGVPMGCIEEDPTLGRGRKTLLVEVYGQISSQDTSWIESSLRQHIEKEGVNFVCVIISSAGGSLTDSLRLAMYLASLDSSRVRTVAYVETQARADAALIALACDQLAMANSAVLGGPGARRISSRALADLRAPIRELTKAKGRGWSLPLALIDPQVRVSAYTREGTGEVRYFCEQELDECLDAGQRWAPGAEIDTQSGLTGSAAVALGLAQMALDSEAEFRRAYDLDQRITKVKPNWAHRVVEILASPTVAGGLLFIGWFALMIEFASPGLSVSGFVSAVCFLLFFWANFLHGTAGWLDVLLFLTGVICIVLEIFVIPGLGAFGIGGGLLIVISIVLASQTFVIIPRNAYELNQVPVSLYMVAAAGSGAFASLIVMRKLFTQAPFFRRIALDTPDEQRRQEIEYQEALAHREHLLDKRGVATTPLRPSGKARFGDDVVDVLTDGDMIPAGTPVFVVKVKGNEVQVRAV